MDVWVTDNSSTKRRGQYIAYAVTRAADGPDGMEARGRPFSVGRKGLRLCCCQHGTPSTGPDVTNVSPALQARPYVGSALFR